VLCKHEVVGSIPSGSTRWLIACLVVCALLLSSGQRRRFFVRILYSPACASRGLAGYLTSYRGDRSEFGSAEQSAEADRLSPERFRRLPI
jgi:hypothetical protein